MGSPFTIILYSTDSLQANSIAQQCFTTVDDYVNSFSDYLDSSELNRLCATAGTGQAFSVSFPLLNILLQAKHAFEKSSGTFDITLGPVTKLWRKARKENIFPSPEGVKTKLDLTGFEKVTIDTNANTVALLQHGMQLDLGGIAQGYIAQKVIDFLKSKNISNALVNVSGDIVASDRPPGIEGWTVGVNMPKSTDNLLNQTLLISNKAVTTSGDVYQFMEHDGKRYSHIVHPKTGYGITSQRNVTVIADDGTTADWLTKACSLLSIRKAKKLAGHLKAELLITEMKQNRLVVHATKGFARYWKPSPNP